MSRLAAVDVGTNSVLLLVAERGVDGVLRPVREEAEITRLGRGVDRSGVLSAEGLETTLEVLGRFAEMARRSGARALVVTATSAARDASNGAEFLARARERTGATVEILPGDEEARLSYLAVAQDFAADAGEAGLLAIDVGGGSTEFVHGQGRTVLFRRSLDIGSVRLTERCIHTDPPPERRAGRGPRRRARRSGHAARLPPRRPGGGRRGHRHQPLRHRPRHRAVRRLARARRLALGGRRGLGAGPALRRAPGRPARGCPGSSRSGPTCCPPGRSSSRPRSATSARRGHGSRTAGSAGESCSTDGSRSDDRADSRGTADDGPLADPRRGVRARGPHLHQLHQLPRPLPGARGAHPDRGWARHRPRAGRRAPDGVHRRLHRGRAARRLHRRPLPATLRARSQHLPLEPGHARERAGLELRLPPLRPRPGGRGRGRIRHRLTGAHRRLLSAEPPHAGALDLLRRHPGGLGAGVRPRRLAGQRLLLADRLLRRRRSRDDRRGAGVAGPRAAPGCQRGGGAHRRRRCPWPRGCASSGTTATTG